MKLKYQFGILLGGIIIIPLLALAMNFVIQNYLDSQMEAANPSLFNPARIRHQKIDSSFIAELEKLKEDVHPNVKYTVFGENNRIMYSSLDEFKPGTQSSTTYIWDYICKNSVEYSLHFIPITEGDIGTQNAKMLLLQLPLHRRPLGPAGPPSPADIIFRRWFNSFIPLVIILIFSSIVSIFMLRRLTSSIVHLENGIRKVTEGDLDFPFPIKKGNDEIASLQQSFEHMRQALKEEYAKRSRFILGVSHDLKTPLALIQGYAEALEDNISHEPEAQKHYSVIIKEKAQHLTRMINELISFLKMETKEWVKTFVEEDVLDFFNELAHRYNHDALLLKRRFSYKVSMAEGVDNPRALMDKSLAFRAFENLLNNALRYTAENGCIELELTGINQEIIVTIRDNGQGIPKNELENVFKPFYRTSPSRREEGLGLGLTLAQSIIDSHGWSLHLASTVGKGTTVTVRIPVAS